MTTATETLIASVLVEREVGALFPVLDSCIPEGEVTTKEGSYDRPSENRHWIRSHQLPHKRHTGILQNTHNVLPH